MLPSFLQSRAVLIGIRIVTLAISASIPLGSVVFAEQVPPDLIQRVDSAELAREANLGGYTVSEHYSVFRNGGSQPAADTMVSTVYKKGQGKQYTVTSRSGSSLLQKYLIDRVLKEEAEVSKSDNRGAILVTSSNYDMEFERPESILGRDCLVLKLTPKRKSQYLVEGHAWVDAQNYHLVRVEGKLSAKPSFFAGIPTIRRDYQELQGFAVATSSRSESSSMLLGGTVLNIEYQNYQVAP
jgi:hypothetical protein